MTSEQRRSVRMRTFLKGRVLFNGGASSMDCLIRDMSASGAKIELSEGAPLPEVFDLFIQNKDAKYRATLRWRRGNAVGITFEDPAARPVPRPAPEPAPAPEPDKADVSLSMLLRRIGELEAENAALRSLLSSMSRGAGTAA